MAARKTIGTSNAPWPEKVRERIRTSMLHNELIKHINGEREMSQTQLAAAKTLLDKVLPNLSHIEHAGDEDKPVHLRMSWAAPRK